MCVKYIAVRAGEASDVIDNDDSADDRDDADDDDCNNKPMDEDVEYIVLTVQANANGDVDPKSPAVIISMGSHKQSSTAVIDRGSSAVIIGSNRQSNNSRRWCSRGS